MECVLERSKNFLSVFSFQLRWRCGYVRKHRGKRAGTEEKKKTDTKRFSHGDKEMKFHAYFYVRFGTHDILKFQCSVFKCNAIGQWWTGINRTNRRIQWHIFPYSGICTMYIQRIGDILLAIKFTHDIMTQARMKTTKKTMRISDLKILRLFFSFSLWLSVSLFHSIKSISLYTLEFSVGLQLRKMTE